MNNVSQPRVVIFLCHLLSCFGEGSAKMNEGFFQDGIFPGKCDLRGSSSGIGQWNPS